MSVKSVVKALFPINCMHNYKIESDGKCYSKICLMNQDPELKELITKKGCGCFGMPQVQVWIKENE